MVEVGYNEIVPGAADSRYHHIATIARIRQVNSLNWDKGVIECRSRVFSPNNAVTLAVMVEALKLCEEMLDALDSGAVRNKFYKGDHS